MSGRVRIALWALLIAQIVAWWTMIGLFAFGAISPLGNGEATYLVFTALFGVGVNFMAATL